MEYILEYTLYDNRLTEDPNDCYAMPLVKGTVTDDDLIADMTGSGSSLTVGEAKLFLQQYKESVRTKLLAGYAINSSLFNITPRIAGVFKNKNDRYDATRHATYLRVKPGLDLKNVQKEYKLAYVEGGGKTLPLVEDFKDIASGQSNSLITIGGVGQITGRRLAFNEADTNQGIFFISESNQAVRVTTMVRNKPSELIFMIPADLAAGTYDMEVRTLPDGNKEVRAGYYEHSLPAR